MILFSTADDMVKHEGVCRQKVNLRKKKSEHRKPTLCLHLCCYNRWWVGFHFLPCGQGGSQVLVLLLAQHGRVRWIKNPPGTRAIHSVLPSPFNHWIPLPIKCPVRHWVIFMKRNGQVCILMDITVKEINIKDSRWCINCYKLEKGHRIIVWKRIEGRKFTSFGFRQSFCGYYA